mgnify:FL=1
MKTMWFSWLLALAWIASPVLRADDGIAGSVAADCPDGAQSVLSGDIAGEAPSVADAGSGPIVEGATAPCGPTRTVLDTVWERQELTCYKTICEKIVEQREIDCIRYEKERSFKEVEYTVCKPVWETRTKTVNYTVSKPVWETVTKEIPYTVCKQIGRAHV